MSDATTSTCHCPDKLKSDKKAKKISKISEYTTCRQELESNITPDVMRIHVCNDLLDCASFDLDLDSPYASMDLDIDIDILSDDCGDDRGEEWRLRAAGQRVR
jgi:hypothetical protein